MYGGKPPPVSSSKLSSNETDVADVDWSTHLKVNVGILLRSVGNQEMLYS